MVTSLMPSFFITNRVMMDAETIISTRIGMIPLVFARSSWDDLMSQSVIFINSPGLKM